MVQTFFEYMRQFLKDRNARDVVEIGSDIQLKSAFNLAPSCRTFYSVNFKKDHDMMRGWYEMHQGMGVSNIELLSGNALQLPDLIHHADVIILQNLLIDGNGEDTSLMWKYRRHELPCTAELWKELMTRFEQAEERAYEGFLKVAKPGHIIRFGYPEEDDRKDKFKKMLVDRLRIDPMHVQEKKLMLDGSDDVWETYIIENP